MTEIICDASVVLKWFKDSGESEVVEARSLLAAHRDGKVTVAVLDLTYYEIGNVLVRALGHTAEQATAVLNALRMICTTIPPGAADLNRAAELAETHNLSFYDAMYAAIAINRASRLATADRALLKAEFGETPTDLVSELGLTGAI